MAYSIIAQKLEDVHQGGVNAGYSWGFENGVEEGNKLGCMVKPI